MVVEARVYLGRGKYNYYLGRSKYYWKKQKTPDRWGFTRGGLVTFWAKEFEKRFGLKLRQGQCIPVKVLLSTNGKGMQIKTMGGE